MPNGTTSTGGSCTTTSLHEALIKRFLPAARWVLTAVVILAAVYTLRHQVPNIGRVLRDLHPAWRYVFASAGLVLATYALLVETWRRVLGRLGGHLGFVHACRAWFVSSLARYIPGSLWQIGALGVLGKQYGVRPTVTAASALLMTILNVLTGMIVFAATGTRSVALGGRGIIAAALGVAALALAPLAAPRLSRIASRILNRDVALPQLTVSAVLIGAAGPAIAWIAYGGAFELLRLGILGPSPNHSAMLDYVAVYTGSYLAGFLSIAPPAGLGIADAAMVALIASFHLATPAQATVLAVVVRLWRTVLELTPGLLWMAFSPARGESPSDRESSPTPR